MNISEINKVLKPFLKKNEKIEMIDTIDFNALIKAINKTLDKKNDAILIYYPTHISDNEIIGHWTLLLLPTLKRKKIEFFDSYGMFPDSELKYSEVGNKMDKNLIKLFILLKSHFKDIPIEYNEFKYQEDNTDYCGLYCILRYLNRDLSNKEFKKKMDKLKKKYKVEKYDQLFI